MLQIFADTHKIIAESIYEDVLDIYNFKLNKKKLLRGSVIPDILPKYKLIRHYKDESINYIAGEIVKLIFVSRFIELNSILDPLAINILSTKIGVISHYLSDYVCLPHAKRWTFFDSMVKHIKYESSLNDYVKSHSFKRNVIDSNDIDVYDGSISNLKVKVIEYIENVVEEYSIKSSFENDLNFALDLNLKITHFVLETIRSYNEEIHNQIIFEF